MLQSLKTLLFSALFIYVYMLVILERIHLFVFHKRLRESDIACRHKFDFYLKYGAIVKN